MLANPSSKQHLVSSPTGSVGSSVRLRRRCEHRVKELESSKRHNRHSGDIGNWSPRILSPRLFRDSGGSDRRQSGDWSYVSFPSSPGTPKGQFPCARHPLAHVLDPGEDTTEEEGPSSLLESKVIASILLNEGGGEIKSASGSPHRYSSDPRSPQTQTPPRCRSAMETLDRKVGSVGVRRKLLGGGVRRGGGIEEEESSHVAPKYRPVPSSKNAVSKVKRRSQSTHQHRLETRFSDVLVDSEETSGGGGLGRRSATQWELSRGTGHPSSVNSETEDCLTPPSSSSSHHRHRSRKAKELVGRWKSSEHVDQLTESCDEDDFGKDECPLGRHHRHMEARRVGGFCEENKTIMGRERGGLLEENGDEDEDEEDSLYNSTLKKGLLWQQRDKIFSRWKERFFILTKDYLQCFKKENHSRLSEMGGFVFKLKLSEVELVELVDKKGYLTVCLSLPKDGKILLRKNEGIKDWFALLKNCVSESQARGVMKTTEEFWSKKNFQDSPNGSPSNFDRWLLARQRLGGGQQQCGNYVVNATEDFMSLPVVSSPIDAEYYHRKSRQLKDITSPLTNHRTPSKSRRSTSRNNHLNYVDIGSPSDSPRDNQRKSLFVSDTNFDSGNDSMNTNTSTGGSTDSSNKEIRSRSKSRGPVIPENDYESLKHSSSKDKFRDRCTTDIQYRLHKRESGEGNNGKSNYNRRSQFIGSSGNGGSSAQSTRV